jgi:DNA-binding Lrp family transcriptional regulator
MVLGLLADGKPKSHRDVVRASGLSEPAVWQSLRRAWEKQLILRTKKLLYEPEKLFKGRAGTKRNLRAYHLYTLRPKGMDLLQVDGNEYVSFSRRYLDPRGGGVKSKAGIIREFLETNPGKAYYSTQIVEALKGEGVRAADVMANARRWERRGFVYVRGYRSNDRETPFKEGYLLAWIDPLKQAPDFGW